MTFPLVLNLGTALDYYGDNIYNIWLMGRDGSKLLTSPCRLTEADILYPHTDSFWRGNHCYAPSIVFALLWRVTGKPVLANNILYLAGITLNACAAYWLSLYLWRGGFGAFISGLAYGYCPFAFSGYGTTNFQMMFWIPLALLAFLNFLATRRARYGCAFICCCFMIFMTAAEYGLALLMALAILFVLNVVYRKSFTDFLDRRIWFLALGAFAVIGVTLLTNWPLLRDMDISGGKRSLEEVQEGSMDLKNYFAPTPGNILFGRIARPLYRDPTWYNSPGYAAWALSLLAVFLAIRAAARRREAPPSLLPAGQVFIWAVLILLMIMISLGPRMRAFGHEIGPGPYLIAMRPVPGLNMIRVFWPIARVAVLGLSVLAGGGAAWLFARAAHGSRPARVTCVLLPVIMLIEYAQGPTMVGTPYFQLPNEPPPVYRWLAQQPGRAPVLELPMPADPWESTPIGNELLYMYWQLFHGKPLVNGICAFYPPDYRLLGEISADFPSAESIDAIGLYRPHYIIVHFDAYPPGRARKIRGEIVRQKRRLRVIAKFPATWVLELTPEVLSGAHAESPPGDLLDVPPSSWSATASRNRECAGLAFDRDLKTHWSTPPNQRRGDFFEVRLPGEKNIAQIRMHFEWRGDVGTYPRNLRLEISDDGKEWREIHLGSAYFSLLKAVFEEPKTDFIVLDFKPVSARFLRFTLDGNYDLIPWSISELFILEMRPRS